MANSLVGGRVYNIYSGYSAVGNFDITDATAGNIPRFTITASGGVGIGTTTPAYSLDVRGDTRTNDTIFYK